MSTIFPYSLFWIISGAIQYAKSKLIGQEQQQK